MNRLKRLFACIILVMGISFVSCSKEELPVYNIKGTWNKVGNEDITLLFVGEQDVYKVEHVDNIKLADESELIGSNLEHVGTIQKVDIQGSIEEGTQEINRDGVYRNIEIDSKVLSSPDSLYGFIVKDNELYALYICSFSYEYGINDDTLIINEDDKYERSGKFDQFIEEVISYESE